MRHLGYNKQTERPAGLSNRHTHTRFGSQHKQECVLQDGRLYTANGKRIPEDLPEGLSPEDYAIPGELMYLVTGGQPHPNAAKFFPEQPSQNFIPGLADFDPNEIRAAVEILRQARAGSRSLPQTKVPGVAAERSVQHDDILAGVSAGVGEAPSFKLFAG